MTEDVASVESNNISILDLCPGMVSQVSHLDRALHANAEIDNARKNSY